MVKSSSKNSQAEGNENEFENTLRIPLDITLPRTPLDTIPDPSQFSKEFLHEALTRNGFRDKSLDAAGSTSNRRKFDSAHTTPARTNFVGHLGSCTGPRVLQTAGERGGGLSRVSRNISSLNFELLPSEVPHFELVEDPSFWNDHNVQVIIRMRPLSNMEKMAQGCNRCLKQESLQTLVWLGNPEVKFTFDHIISETISQEKLFSVVGLPMIDNCMSGYNSCMFAYGQTGSGKTYTMMGEISQNDGKLVDDCGMTPRLFEYLFTRIKLEEESRRDDRLKYSCKCSFLEIYNEQITDLLEPSSTNLQLREGLKEGVYVENLTEYNVTTVDEVLNLLLQGAANRKVAGTDMNSASSRSHSVFTCVVESRWEEDSVAHHRFGRLNLVDLAGSERQRSSGTGERLKEASYINKSLSTLGLVIMSLVDVTHGKHRHVPYRDSRLTFLLQDSLGGNSKTTIIANVSPSMCAANETLSSLKFAQRAKLIQNNAKVNEDASQDVTALQRQIQMLKEQMFLMKHQKVSHPLFQVGPTFQPILGEFYESGNSSEKNIYVDSSVINDQQMKMRHLETTLLGDSSGEFAGTACRTTQSQIKQKHRLVCCKLALPNEDVQHTKQLLKFREEKIKRLELFANGITTTESYLMDENNALMEEILQLQARIDGNPEMTSLEDCNEHSEREALLAEVLLLHDQVEENYIEHKFQTEKENEDAKASMELEQYKCVNSKLIRKVDELKKELHKYIRYSQTAVYPVETVLSNIALGDEMRACNQAEDRVLCDNNGLERTTMWDANLLEELMDARTLMDTMKSQQAILVEELQYVRQENDRLVEILTKNNKPHIHPILKHETHISESILLENQNTDQSMMDLQSRLDKMSKDLEDLKILNDPLKNQVDLVHEEVENEATNAILNLQEELASLQVKYHRRLCTMSEENNKLKRIVAAKEDEVYALHSDWEKASLELTNFLLDGAKSLKDASGQIENIASSFPHYNVSVGKHVKKAAMVCIEKEQTILQLEKNLVDAQCTIQQMQEKLNSLRTATIAFTEIRYNTEHDEKTKEEYRIVAELVAIKNKLDNMMDYLSSISDPSEDFDGSATDISTSSSILSDDEDVLENMLCGQTSSKQVSEKTHLFLKKQFLMAYEAFIKLDVQLVAVFNNKDSKKFQIPEMQESAAGCFTEMKSVEEKDCKASSFFSKFEETHATMNEVNNVLNALLIVHEEAKLSSGRWKQTAEEVMGEKASLIEEISHLKFDLQLRNEEHAIHKVELENLVSMLEGSFKHLQKEAGDLCQLIYTDALAMIHETRHIICKTRSSLQDIYAERIEKGFASLVVQQCHIGEYINKFGLPDEKEKYNVMVSIKGTGELGASDGDLIGENMKLQKELERKTTLLNGLFFDFSLLQESASTRRDKKDEAEKLFTALSQVQHELKMKTNQLDEMMVGYEKLESCLTDTEAALSASKSCLLHSEETVNALSYQNAELKSFLEDLYLNKSETEKQLEEHKEMVKTLENEIHCTTSSTQEHFLFSLEGITDDLKRVSAERDQLCEQINSLQDRLETAYAIADEKEAIAVEARQESQASKIYAEQKEEEVKILEHSVEELDSTINMLEKRVKEMEEEMERHHKIRDSLEVELQSLSQRLLTFESFRNGKDYNNTNVGQPEDQISRKSHSRYLELQEAYARIKDLEDERTEQANEIKQCKEYISELVIHAEAQASQYQQKYKSLETMVHIVQMDSSKSVSEVPLSDKADKISFRARGSSSPFRCIGNLVQQMNTEKDQELSLAKLHLEELETLASNRQKEICMLNTKLAAAESMTHDVIRDLLGVKLDMTNYANLINQNQLQRFIEDAAQQTHQFLAMEQENRKLKRQINDLHEERDRCISELHSKEADLLAIKMTLMQLQGRDQLLTAQNEMLKADKTNLQRRAGELDDMIKKLLGTQPTESSSQQHKNPMPKACSSSEYSKRLANSEKLLLHVNNELAQYCKPGSSRLHHKIDEKRVR